MATGQHAETFDNTPFGGGSGLSTGLHVALRQQSPGSSEGQKLHVVLGRVQLGGGAVEHWPVAKLQVVPAGQQTGWPPVSGVHSCDCLQQEPSA